MNMPVLLSRGRLERVVLGRRQHPDELDVAAERDRLDAVLGLAPAGGPDRAAESDEVLRHLHAELLGRDHVADLVQTDRDGHAHGEDDHAEHEQQDSDHGVSGVSGVGVAASSVSVAHAPRRRRAAPASTVSSSSEGTPGSRSTRSIVGTMSVKRSRPSRKRATQTSLAAL